MEKKTISKSEKRWLVREIESGRMSIGEARERIEFFSKDPNSLIRNWLKIFSSEMVLSLPVMTGKDRQKLETVQKRLKDMERQLEDAQIKNTALETMIDIAEEQLKINIRKKSGPKQ